MKSDKGLKMYNIYLGRFCPLHNEHLKIIRELENKENSLILIGSATTTNRKTPYPYSVRYSWIKSNLIPNSKIKILPLPDIKSNIEWIILLMTTIINTFNIKDLDNKLEFHCGSNNDIKDIIHYLPLLYNIKLFIKNYERNDKISGTICRKLIKDKKFNLLKYNVPENVFTYFYK